MRSAFGPNAFRTDVNLSHPLRAAPDRDNAGARDLDQAERQHERDETLDLIARSGDLEHETLGRGVNDTGAERVGEAERLHPMLALAAHLDHGELALDVRAGHGHVDDPMHRASTPGSLSTRTESVWVSLCCAAVAAG